MGIFIVTKPANFSSESIAYYSLGHRDAYVYETSNGCANGGSLEEAIFHGILEIVERDAFCSLGMLNYLFPP